MEIRVRKIEDKEIEEMKAVMAESFAGEPCAAVTKKDFGGSGYLDGQKLENWLQSENYKVYCCFSGENAAKIVGGAAVELLEEDNVKYARLEKIFVAPVNRGSGIAAEMYSEIEKLYDVEKWECKTPILSRRDHGFFVHKCGFRVASISSAKNLKDGEYLMRKVIKKA